MAHILVVDDDEQLRLLARRILEHAGHEVTEAANGGQALKHYRRVGAELVLCDIFMPEREGLETIRELRRCCPTVKIVAMSGGMPGGGMDFLPVARRFGAAQVLAKPFGRAALLQAIEATLQDRPFGELAQPARTCST
jgi:CheY-like chemotaxis protein